MQSLGVHAALAADVAVADPLQHLRQQSQQSQQQSQQQQQQEQQLQQLYMPAVVSGVLLSELAAAVERYLGGSRSGATAADTIVVDCSATGAAGSGSGSSSSVQHKFVLRGCVVAPHTQAQARHNIEQVSCCVSLLSICIARLTRRRISEITAVISQRCNAALSQPVDITVHVTRSVVIVHCCMATIG
jgi:hypothetical protein